MRVDLVRIDLVRVDLVRIDLVTPTLLFHGKQEVLTRFVLVVLLPFTLLCSLPLSSYLGQLEKGDPVINPVKEVQIAKFTPQVERKKILK